MSQENVEVVRRVFDADWQRAGPRSTLGLGVPGSLVGDVVVEGGFRGTEGFFSVSTAQPRGAPDRRDAICSTPPPDAGPSSPASLEPGRRARRGR
jgi:hypothetical protein